MSAQSAQKSDVEAILELVRRRFSPAPQITNKGKYCENLLLWTIRRRPLLAPNVPFDLPHHKYLIGIYTCTARTMVVKKASQLGVSEWAVSKAFHTCDLRSGNVMYVMPTTDDVGDFSRMRFKTALEASSYLKSIQRTVDVDRVGLKRFRDNFLVFRGGKIQDRGDERGKARQLKSVPVDVGIIDEVDETDERVGGIVSKRLGHSNIKEMAFISTPSYIGTGIDALWDDSCQYEWHIPCIHCGQWQMLSIDNCVLEYDDLRRPLRWHGQKEKRAWIACTNCSKEMDRLVMGEWVARFPDREVAGFHPTKLMTVQTPLIDIVKALQTTNDDDKKETVNQDLGEAYTPKGGRLTDAELNKCLRDYSHGASGTAVMGVDVGKLINVVIRSLPDKETGERKQLLATEVTSFDDLIPLMKKYKVRVCVIDALPEERLARKFQDEFPKGVVWPCYYTDLKSTEPIQWDSKFKHSRVLASRTRTLDETFSRFYDMKNTLPGDARSILNYYSHMKALVKVLERRRDNKVVAKYLRTSPDHYAQAENYCTIASMRPLGWVRR